MDLKVSTVKMKVYARFCFSAFKNCFKYENTSNITNIIFALQIK